MDPNQPDQPNQIVQPTQPARVNVGNDVRPQTFNAPYTAPFAPAPPVPAPPAEPTVSSGGRPHLNKLALLIVGGVGLILIMVILIIVAGGSKKPATTNTPATNATAQPAGPQAATATGLQLLNDSISQDISSLNDDKDFPTTKFTDQALGL